jgi:hypothetical protein
VLVTQLHHQSLVRMQILPLRQIEQLEHQAIKGLGCRIYGEIINALI